MRILRLTLLALVVCLGAAAPLVAQGPEILTQAQPSTGDLPNHLESEVRHALMYTIFDRYGGRADRDWSAEFLTLYGDRISHLINLSQVSHVNIWEERHDD